MTLNAQCCYAEGNSLQTYLHVSDSLINFILPSNWNTKFDFKFSREELNTYLPLIKLVKSEYQ
jgi:hypothetical protein